MPKPQQQRNFGAQRVAEESCARLLIPYHLELNPQEVIQFLPHPMLPGSLSFPSGPFPLDLDDPQIAAREPRVIWWMPLSLQPT